MKSVVNILKVPELRKKIFLTFGLLLVYRVGFQIPLPGVELDRLLALEQRQQGSGLSFAFGIMNALSGASVGSLALFSLGVMPYISASIILSLLTKAVPALEQLSKEGTAGRKKIQQFTRYLTIPLCLVQGLFILTGLIAPAVRDMGVIDPDLFNSFFYKVMLLMALTTGTLFIMWLGEQITEYGIGNGISLIIMAGIISGMPQQFSFFMDSLEESARYQTATLFLAIFIVVTGFVVFIHKGQRRIPIQQAKLTRGRKVMGGQRHYLPLKVNSANVMPIIFASALFIIPPFLANIPFLSFIGESLAWGKFWYILIFSILIYFFSFFWTALMFQPNEIANNLKEYGGFVPGMRPGKKTAEYLERVMVRVTLAGATFLALVAILPQFVTKGIKDIPISLATFLGGTSILIVVSVALDLVDKVNAQLVMRNYEGFMGSGSGGGSSSWARSSGGGGGKK